MTESLAAVGYKGNLPVNNLYNYNIKLIEKSFMHHSKRLKATLIITLIALQLVPFDSVLSAAKLSKNAAQNAVVQAQNVPLKITLPDTDWTSTDWNSDVVLRKSRWMPTVSGT